METETSKKSFYLFFLIILVLIVVFGGFYFYKFTLTKQIPTEQTTQVPLSGLEKDLDNKLLSIFPLGIVPETDIKSIIESFSFSKEGQPKQYTVRYISKTNYIKNNQYFLKKFGNGFQGFGISNILRDDLKQISTFMLKNEYGEQVVITINQIINTGTVVDITYIK